LQLRFTGPAGHGPVVILQSDIACRDAGLVEYCPRPASLARSSTFVCLPACLPACLLAGCCSCELLLHTAISPPQAHQPPVLHLLASQRQDIIRAFPPIAPRCSSSGPIRCRLARRSSTEIPLPVALSQQLLKHASRLLALSPSAASCLVLRSLSTAEVLLLWRLRASATPVRFPYLDPTTIAGQGHPG
jgi:hypothetical protein